MNQRLKNKSYKNLQENMYIYINGVEKSKHTRNYQKY